MGGAGHIRRGKHGGVRKDRVWLCPPLSQPPTTTATTSPANADQSEWVLGGGVGGGEVVAARSKTLNNDWSLHCGPTLESEHDEGGKGKGVQTLQTFRASTHFRTATQKLLSSVFMRLDVDLSHYSGQLFKSCFFPPAPSWM